MAGGGLDAAAENQFAKIAVARDKYPVLHSGALQYDFVVILLKRQCRLEDIMPCCDQGLGELTADIRIAQKFHAARARPMAISFSSSIISAAKAAAARRCSGRTP